MEDYHIAREVEVSIHAPVRVRHVAVELGQHQDGFQSTHP